MSTYNADTDYELIDYFGLFDLANARVVQAQINSINGETNSASITLSGECAALAAVDTSEVKFFYHCENSTGTLEDLANGHQAFKADDFVYCLHMPYVSDDMPERFFIIGHVDKKGTERCAIGDYVTMDMGLNPTYGPNTGIDPTERHVTIFDVSRGEVLNLGAFVPLPGSPPAPASLPCLADDTWTAWIAHNFEIPAPRHSCPLYAEEYDADITVTSVVNIPVIYTGCELHWRKNYSDGGYEDHYAEADWFDLNSGGTSYRSVSASREDYDVLPIERQGWKLRDGVTGVTYYAYVGGERTVLGDGSCVLGGIVNATVQYNHSLRYKATFDNIEVVKENIAGSAPLGPGFAGIKYQDMYFVGRYCVSVSGEYGFYVLCGGSESYHSRDLPVDYGVGTGGSVSYPCNEEIAYAQILPYPWEYDSITNRAAVGTKGLSYCMAVLFDDVTGDKEYTLSPARCLSVMDHTISRNMEAAFAPLKKRIFDLTNDTRTYGAWAWEEPTLGVLKKKEL